MASWEEYEGDEHKDWYIESASASVSASASASGSASESVIETLHASYLFARGWTGGSSFFKKYFVIVIRYPIDQQDSFSRVSSLLLFTVLY